MLLFLKKKHCQFYMFSDQDKEKVNKAKNSKENGSRVLGFISKAMTISTMGS